MRHSVLGSEVRVWGVFDHPLSNNQPVTMNLKSTPDDRNRLQRQG